MSGGGGWGSSGGNYAGGGTTNTNTDSKFNKYERPVPKIAAYTITMDIQVLPSQIANKNPIPNAGISLSKS